MSKVIAFSKREQKQIDDWVEKRKKPGKLEGMMEGSRFSGLDKKSLKLDFDFQWSKHGQLTNRLVRARVSSPLLHLKSFETSSSLRMAEFEKLKLITPVKADLQVLKRGSIFIDQEACFFQVAGIYGWRLKTSQNTFTTHAVLLCKVMKVIEDSCIYDGMPCDYVTAAANMLRLVEATTVSQVLICIRCCNNDCVVTPDGKDVMHECEENKWAVVQEKMYPENQP